ncbi:50S rRNA methyltransferase, partial [Streptomyces albidoflavus]
MLLRPPPDGPDSRAHGIPPVHRPTADLLLPTPPLHPPHAATDATARRMFAAPPHAPRPGGELWVVANRHLGHHRQLRRLFGNCVTAASDPKFVVLRAV